MRKPGSVAITRLPTGVPGLDTVLGGGLPEYWVTRFDKTIASGSSSPNLADGKGLDHMVPMVGEDVVALYFAALEQ